MFKYFDFFVYAVIFEKVNLSFRIWTTAKFYW